MKRFVVCLLAVSHFSLYLPDARADSIDGESLPKRIVIFGASGRIGGYIVDEALLRGYQVTGVSRDPLRLNSKADSISVATADILDSERLAELIERHDAIIVSVGGKPADPNPAKYIAATAAQSLVDTLEVLGANGPRLIFVGNLYTLKFEDGKTLLELGRVPASHPNLAMFKGHQLALNTFRHSDNVNWTVASPPNGLRLKGRTTIVRWGGEKLLRDADGTPSTISPEDFAYAVIEELERGQYIRQQFNVAR